MPPRRKGKKVPLAWVLDCSIILGAFLPDERSSVSDRFLEGISDDELWVPALFWYELAAVLARCVRQGRIPEAAAHRAVENIRSLLIKTDYLLGPELVHRGRQLGCRLELSAYDAVYLELAMRRGAGLATLDASLSEKAIRSGVVVFS